MAGVVCGACLLSRWYRPDTIGELPGDHLEGSKIGSKTSILGQKWSFLGGGFGGVLERPSKLTPEGQHASSGLCLVKVPQNHGG